MQWLEQELHAVHVSYHFSRSTRLIRDGVSGATMATDSSPDPSADGDRGSLLVLYLRALPGWTALSRRRWTRGRVTRVRTPLPPGLTGVTAGHIPGWLAGRLGGQEDGWVILGQVLCSGDGACLPGLLGGTAPGRTAVDKSPPGASRSVNIQYPAGAGAPYLPPRGEDGFVNIK